MCFCGATHQTDSHGELYCASQAVIRTNAPLRQSRVPPVLCRKSMGARFDRAPVVSRGDYYGVNTVHNTLVMRGSTIGIDLSKSRGFDDAFYDLLPLKLLCRKLPCAERHAGAYKPFVGQIRQDPETCFSSCELFDQGGHVFSHGIDGIGPHGVTYID